MKTADIKKLQLNYRELAFVSDKHSAKECKEFFEEVEGEKIDTSTLIEVSKLLKYFHEVKSIDPRYDGMNYLILKLKLMGSGYLKWMQDNSVFKAGGFTGGKAVFYKILDEKQLSHVNSYFEKLNAARL